MTHRGKITTQIDGYCLCDCYLSRLELINVTTGSSRIGGKVVTHPRTGSVEEFAAVFRHEAGKSRQPARRGPASTVGARSARVNPYCHLRAREGADGQAVVCPLLRGSSPTRWVAPKQHWGLRRAFSPAFRASSLYPLARGCRRIWRGEVWFRPARCCSTGSGRLGGAAAAGRTMERSPAAPSPI